MSIVAKLKLYRAFFVSLCFNSRLLLLLLLNQSHLLVRASGVVGLFDVSACEMIAVCLFSCVRRLTGEHVMLVAITRAYRDL